MKSTEAMAIRAINAENGFIENVKNTINCSDSDAKAIMKFYLKSKLMKIDYQMGRMMIKDGRFYEADVLSRALDMAKKA